MKKTIATWLVVGTAVMMGPAPAGASTSSDLRKIKQQIHSLRVQVSNLNAQVSLMQTCLLALPIERIGDTSGMSGYLFQPPGAVSPTMTTALDIGDFRDSNSLGFIILDPACTRQLHFGQVRPSAMRSNLPAAARRFGPNLHPRR